VSNATYVCFDCRTTERTPASRITRNCRAIQSQVLPRLRKEKDWIERILSTYPDLRPYRRRMLMRQIRRIEEERAGWLDW